VNNQVIVCLDFLKIALAEVEAAANISSAAKEISYKAG